MDIAHLLKRRADVVARHELLESVPGSGYHPDDDQARGEARKGRPPLSKRPVALQHDGKAWLVGPDVAAVKAAVGKFATDFERKQAEHKRDAEAAGIQPSPPAAQAAHAAKVCTSVAGTPADGLDAIELTSADFNAVLFGLNELGIPVVSTGVLP